MVLPCPERDARCVACTNVSRFTLTCPRIPTHRYEWVVHGEIKGTALWGPISEWDTSAVTSMEKAFSKRTTFNADLSAWDTSSVTNMDSVFDDAYLFTGSVADWDVSKVNTCESMFRDATVWNGDLSRWNVTKVGCCTYTTEQWG